LKWLFHNGGFGYAQPPSATLNHHRLRSTTIGYAQPPFWWIIVIWIRDENQLIRWLSEVETTGELHRSTTI